MTTYIHYSAMNLQLCMEIGFLSRKISSHPFSSVLIIMHDITVHVHVVQLPLEEANTHSGTVGYAPEKYNCFINPFTLLKITSHCNSTKVFGLGL